MPFDQRTYIFVEVNMPVSSHWCLRGLGVLHPKPLEKILSVLRLGDESAVLELLHLESKEVGQLAHHRHLEFLHHHPAKFLTRLLVSRTKYYVININLANKEIIVASLCEKSGISFPNLESIRNKEISKAFIPCSWRAYIHGWDTCHPQSQGVVPRIPPP
jgi:hypothetical protein